ncbi:hypothetical protein L207DRAFT_642847 [Hyaloscypha variabilis F]|uniref:Uncharacterized protein n=1 Tax=Hyaloscypha variabilis (strain UAMH 11265 / GT02V1 / F) TaxID=1149755 RepID=A0A2J6QRD7_HYAVF|nr:hypothetical protein L207DRAFT_642847 [Hyaloscypha variabilis F]
MERQTQAKEAKPGKNQLEQKGSKPPRSQNGVRRGLGAAASAKTRERPITQFALENLRDAESQELTRLRRRTNVKPRQTKKSSEISPTVRSLARNLQQLMTAPQYLPQIQSEFKIRDRAGAWKLANALLVDPSDPSEVKRIALKYMRKRERIHIFDTNLRMLTPQTCFQDVKADGTNTILLIPELDIDTDNLLSAVSKKRSDLQTNSEADLSVAEPTPEDGSEGEETDKRPLSPLHVEALCKYCGYEIRPILAQSVGEYAGEEPMGKNEVLAMICRPTFVIFWYKLLDEKEKEGEDMNAPYPYDEERTLVEKSKPTSSVFSILM